MTDVTVPAGQRLLARLAFVAAGTAVVVVLVAAGVRAGAGLVLVGAGGTVMALVGAWWFLTHRGLVRWLAGMLVLLAPLTVVVLYVQARLAWVVVVCALLWLVALACGRRALAPGGGSGHPVEREVPPPRRPYLIMNPKSGGGKVVRFGLAELAQVLGAEVCVLDGPQDVAVLARRAVDDGADLLGVAGGDGTQAIVAGVAAERGVPFMVISAGTRNHFALDLGLDRDDPRRCLDALSDGVEVRVDLCVAGDRVFVNNASFGAYAEVVRSPAYRDGKTRTTLSMLPGLLTGPRAAVLRVRVDEAELVGAQAVLVSNNPYGSGDLAGLGRRPRLDGGVLGVLAVTVRNAAEAAGLVRGRRRSSAVFRTTATEVVITADTPSLAVGVDGEAVTMPAPVRCVVKPGALRVRVPRHRPGVPSHRPELDWARLRGLALSRRPFSKRPLS
ncbi:diacylglycerol kinase family protein [Lentzea sp. BCCO 10_0856]|uniref:Diacylglycerol kinase family protein n=1 Tax=Lentzea miocenica TaxID=3095431 RepID=A0ABU4SZD7_9PSEU|nr:diacylglycerol kinase family protein [Lentzea sp. BCCO 10_0856]MDX8031271.1 diacylglycerol kinase family protein [Lentzea sp. BCCO 10_0856]